MSEPSHLERHISRLRDPTIAASLSDADAPDDLSAFGWLRGSRERAVMLELRKKDGHVLAVGYAWLERAEFDPSEGITLYIADQKIRIGGRNLNAEARPAVRLFEGLTRHRVPWIQEANEPESIGVDAAIVVIDRIEW